VQAACIGAGMRTSHVVADVEERTGKPLVATDLAAHWVVMRAAGLRSRPGFGRLLDTLA
jgi:maleate cis-trans isomerase